MPFRLRRDARAWFSYLEKEFGKGDAGVAEAPLFDMYYLCLMAGLAAGEPLPEVPAAETSELVDNFPGEYRERGRLIIGFFLSRELRQLGIGLTERDALHGTISRLVNPHSPSRLSDEGMNRMNQYAHGGFDVLSARFDDKPRHLETFVPLYVELIREFASHKHTSHSISPT
jgi:hypothetical protein